MAAAGLGDELNCFICGNIYTEPVMLPCGHNFCLTCITESLKTQDESQFYTCPKCGKRFSTRPSLQRNTRLCAHMERLQSARQNTNCSEHNMPLMYYCHQDCVCYCMDCSVLGKHEGHPVDCLNEASEKKKKRLREHLYKLVSKREEVGKNIETFLKSQRTSREKASHVREQVIAIFRHLREQLCAQESEIYMQEEKISRYYTNLILELKKKAKEQFKTIINIENILCMNDPLSVLQQPVSDEATIAQQEKEESKEVPPSKDLDAERILSNIYRIFSATLADVKKKFKKKGATDESLHDNQEEDTMPGSKRQVVAGSSRLGDSRRMEKKRKRERFQSEKTSPAPDSASLGSVPSANTKVYRLSPTSAGRHTCSETRIKFEVTGPMILEYGLESWDNHMTDTLRNKYEIIGPLFHIITQGQNKVSAVYLPHYLSPECYKEYKSYIKCAHFKDNKIILESPTKIESSYVVLENPTCSYLGAVVEKILTFITRPFTFNGVVLIYCKIDVTYCFRLYVMIDNEPRLKRAIEMEIGPEFHCISKPPQTNSVYVMKDYDVQGPHGAVIEPQVVRFRFTCPSQLYPYTEITLQDINEEIQLSIADHGTKRIIWSCSLRREVLEQFRRIKRPEQLPISEEKRFVQRNYGSLCKRLGLLSPILLSLREKGVINESEEEEITRQHTSLKCNRTLLNMIINKGAEQKFYETLKENNSPLVEDLEHLLPEMKI